MFAVQGYLDMQMSTLVNELRVIRLQGTASLSERTIGERTRCLKRRAPTFTSSPLPQHLQQAGQARRVSESTGGGVRNGSFREDLGLVRDLPQSFDFSSAPKSCWGAIATHSFPSGWNWTNTLLLGQKWDPVGGLGPLPQPF